MESAKEQNYWPAFVDALSNVVLTLVFVLVVFVFALVLSSNKVEKRAQELIQAAEERASENDVSPQVKITTLRTELRNAKSEIETLKEILKQKEAETPPVDVQVEAQKELIIKGAGIISQEQGKIIIHYPKAVADLDEKSVRELDKVIADFGDKVVNGPLVMVSYVGQESYSAGRRLAYYRAVGMKNYLVTKFGVKAENIRSKILEPTEPQNGRIEILFD